MKGETDLGENVFKSDKNQGIFYNCISQGDLWSGEDIEGIALCYEEAYGQKVSDSGIVRIYADYPEHYKDELYIGAFEFVQSHDIDPVIIGGQIINPSQASLTYASASGKQLHAPMALTGPKLADYTVKSLLTTYPDVTEADLASIYYRQGQQLTVQPLEITGYQTPSPQTITLASGDNEVSFVYRSMSGDGSSDGSGDSSDESDDDEPVGAPNTGIGMILKSKIGVAIGLIVLVLTVTGLLLRRKRAQMGALKR